MAYVKNTWATGDTITAEKMNHMEDGIAGGGALIVGIEYDEQTEIPNLNKTWQEIYDAVSSGRGAVLVGETEEEGQTVSQFSRLVLEASSDTSITPPQYQVLLVNEESWTTDSADGYPIEAS